MKKTTIAGISAIAMLLFACNNMPNNGKGMDSIRLISGDKAQNKMMDSAAAMKAWMDFKTPGAMHQLLAKATGQWSEDITIWEGPGAKPQKTTSTCTNTMIMDGRYQQSVHKGNMMGMPFEGMSTIGYDNGRKEFVSYWIDNMGTGFMQMSGSYDSTKKILHLKGTQTDPVSGKPMDVREDFKFLSDGTQILEMYGSQMAGTPEFKVMEIKFTRK